MENNCVTVIIPVYNTDEKFMNKCIESVATQTYKDIEILIVDDGSKESTFEILEEYRKKYKNITVYHKKNEGVSKARNYALDRAKGEWIVFVDSDDYIPKNAIEILVSEAKDCQMVIGRTITGDEKISVTLQHEKNVYKENKDDIIKSALLSSKTSISNAIGICSKLYNLKFLNDNKIRFNTELTHGEDLIFNLSCYLKADTIIAISDYVYTYVKENQDSVTTKFSPGLHKKHFKIINVLNEGFKESVVNRYKQNYCDFLLYLLGMCIKKEILHKANTATYVQKICLFKEIISNEYYIECFKNVDKKKLGKGRRLLVDICQYKMYWLIIVYYLLKH